jgi:hypothetical protein
MKIVSFCCINFGGDEGSGKAKREQTGNSDRPEVEGEKADVGSLAD